MQAPTGENPGIANVRVRVGTAYRWSVPAQCSVLQLEGHSLGAGPGRVRGPERFRSGAPERVPSVSGSAAGSWQVRGGSAASGADP